MEVYDFFYINDYYIEFCKDFSSIIENKEELITLFLNSLAKNYNFDLIYSMMILIIFSKINILKIIFVLILMK